MATLLIASSNPGKLQELHTLLKGLKLNLLKPDAIGIESQVEESGKDYAENARLKASAYARASGLWTLADDSGLEVEVLDEGGRGLLGLASILSARGWQAQVFHGGFSDPRDTLSSLSQRGLLPCAYPLLLSIVILTYLHHRYI